MRAPRRGPDIQLAPRLRASSTFINPPRKTNAPTLTSKMPSQQDDKRQAAREVIDILHEISTLLVRSNPNLPC